MTAPEITTAPLRMTLFGPMQVLVQGHPLPQMRSRKGLWLLALLTLRHGRPVERDWLAGTLWPDVDQSRALASLRPILSELRNGLGNQSERLQTSNRHTLLLDLAGTDVDVISFDAAIAGDRLSELEPAVSLYRGPLLEGCSEEWVFQERVQREHDCIRALLKLADSALTAEDYARAVGYYQRAVNLDPWGDAARRGWMDALARSGDRNAALQVYREFVEMLRDDPNASPDEQTTALYVRLRAQARQASGPPAVAVAERPVRSPVTGYLPHPLTDLVGREDERAEVAARLRRSRLVTLTGMGGIGKTRLAIEVAREVAGEYVDGAWLVALDALSEGKQIVRQIASVLGLREALERPLLDIVTEHLHKKRLLLVLDNCEHLLEAAAQVVGHLLRECERVRVLATSREALGITGEAAWAVPALAMPDQTHLPAGEATLLRVLMSYESMQLFEERARAAHKEFVLTATNARTVAQVCCQLEGIPLAIELAAARVKAMTLEQIAARLHDHLGLLTYGSRTAQSRQQTLRATLDWSYMLLSELERSLLLLLSVFAGGWTLEAAERVCAGEGIETWKILDLLTSLVDKSLVTFEERAEVGGRYRMLEVVRQYAAEQQVTSGDAKRIKARHRDWFVALAEEAAAHLDGEEQGAWLTRLESEHENLRAALAWCIADQDGAKAGLQLAGALHRFWAMHGYYSEGRGVLSEALARDGAGGRTKERARALNGAGILGYYQGNYQAARALHKDGLAIYRDLGNWQGVAWSLNDLGDVAGAQGNRDEARALYEESLAIFRKLGNRQGAASLLHHVGRIFREQGDSGGAQALYKESLAIFWELGNRMGAAWSLYHLGNVARIQGDYQAARTLQEEGLAIFRELGNWQGVAWSLKDLGDIAAARGNRDEARALYEESLAIFRKLGNREGAASLLSHLGRIVREQGDAGTAEAMYEESLAIFRELGNRIGVGWSLNGLGRVALDQGHSALARTLYTEGFSILKELGDKQGVAESLEGLAASEVSDAV